MKFPVVFRRYVALLLCFSLIDPLRAFAETADNPAFSTQTLTPYLASAHFPLPFYKALPLRLLKYFRKPGQLKWDVPEGFENDLYAVTAQKASQGAYEDIYFNRYRRKPVFQHLMEIGDAWFGNDMSKWIELYPAASLYGKPRDRAHQALRQQIGKDVSRAISRWWGITSHDGKSRIDTLVAGYGFIGWVFFSIGLQYLGRHFILRGSGKNPEPINHAVLSTEQDGYLATICLAGEYAKTDEEALAGMGQMITTLNYIREHHQEGKDRHMALKLSSLVAGFNPKNPRHLDLATERAEHVVRAAIAAHVEIEIDGESFSERAAQITIYQELILRLQKPGAPVRLGIAVQSYYKDSFLIVDRLLAHAEANDYPIAVRLVKGAYHEQEKKEAPSPEQSRVYLDQQDTDRNYQRLVWKLMHAAKDSGGRVYPMIASMNHREQAWVFAVAQSLEVPNEWWESQMLYGMQPWLLKIMRARGQRVRLYLLFGDDVITGAKYFDRRRVEITGEYAISRTVYDWSVPFIRLATISPAYSAQGDTTPNPKSWFATHKVKTVLTIAVIPLLQGFTGFSVAASAIVLGVGIGAPIVVRKAMGPDLDLTPAVQTEEFSAPVASPPQIRTVNRDALVDHAEVQMARDKFDRLGDAKYKGRFPLFERLYRQFNNGPYWPELKPHAEKALFRLLRFPLQEQMNRLGLRAHFDWPHTLEENISTLIAFLLEQDEAVRDREIKVLKEKVLSQLSIANPPLYAAFRNLDPQAKPADYWVAMSEVREGKKLSKPQIERIASYSPDAAVLLFASLGPWLRRGHGPYRNMDYFESYHTLLKTFLPAFADLLAVPNPDAKTQREIREIGMALLGGLLVPPRTWDLSSSGELRNYKGQFNAWSYYLKREVGVDLPTIVGEVIRRIGPETLRYNNPPEGLFWLGSLKPKGDLDSLMTLNSERHQSVSVWQLYASDPAAASVRNTIHNNPDLHPSDSPRTLLLIYQFLLRFGQDTPTVIRFNQLKANVRRLRTAA